MHELVAGVDCPHEAAFLDTAALFDSAGAIERPRSLCVFELATGVPLRRHYAQARPARVRAMRARSPTAQCMPAPVGAACVALPYPCLTYLRGRTAPSRVHRPLLPERARGGARSNVRALRAPQEFAPHGEQVSYGGTPGAALVVRGIATAAATDYLTDVLFYPNGAVEARHPPSRPSRPAGLGRPGMRCASPCWPAAGRRTCCASPAGYEQGGAGACQGVTRVAGRAGGRHADRLHDGDALHAGGRQPQRARLLRRGRAAARPLP